MEQSFSVFEIIQTILSVVVLICFFVMGANVGKIRDALNPKSQHEITNATNRIAKAEFLGDKSEVVHQCHVMCWHIIDSNRDYNPRYASKEMIPYIEKITLNGGTLSPALIDFITKHPIPDTVAPRKVVTSVDR